MVYSYSCTKRSSPGFVESDEVGFSKSVLHTQLEMEQWKSEHHFQKLQKSDNCQLSSNLIFEVNDYDLGFYATTFCSTYYEHQFSKGQNLKKKYNSYNPSREILSGIFLILEIPLLLRMIHDLISHAARFNFSIEGQNEKDQNLSRRLSSKR